MHLDLTARTPFLFHSTVHSHGWYQLAPFQWDEDTHILRWAERLSDGRTIAVSSQGGEDLNRWMVREGWAVAYLQYSLDYTLEEADAQSAGRNIWSGSLVMPWDWRRGIRTP